MSFVKGLVNVGVKINAMPTVLKAAFVFGALVTLGLLTGILGIEVGISHAQ